MTLQTFLQGAIKAPEADRVIARDRHGRCVYVASVAMLGADDIAELVALMRDDRRTTITVETTADRRGARRTLETFGA
jgi:hypothetical protein